jgi:hypothetical protein
MLAGLAAGMLGQGAALGVLEQAMRAMRGRCVRLSAESGGGQGAAMPAAAHKSLVRAQYGWPHWRAALPYLAADIHGRRGED